MNVDWERVRQAVRALVPLKGTITVDRGPADHRGMWHCPFPHRNCTTETSLFVSADGRAFYCERCHARGDVLDYVQNRRGIGFYSALRLLAPRLRLADFEQAAEQTPMAHFEKELQEDERSRSPRPTPARRTAKVWNRWEWRRFVYSTALTEAGRTQDSASEEARIVVSRCLHAPSPEAEWNVLLESDESLAALFAKTPVARALVTAETAGANGASDRASVDCGVSGPQSRVSFAGRLAAMSDSRQ